MKAGDKAVITGDKLGHRFDIGSVVKIVDKVDESDYRCKKDGSTRYVDGDDLRRLKNSIQKIEGS